MHSCFLKYYIFLNLMFILHQFYVNQDCDNNSYEYIWGKSGVRLWG